IAVIVCQLQFGRAREFFYTLDEDAPVPGAVEDREVAGRRQLAPEAPKIGACAFVFGGRRDRYHPVLTGIENMGDAADGAALAGRVVAFEEQHDRQLPEGLAAYLIRQAAAPVRELVIVFVLTQMDRVIDQ